MNTDLFYKNGSMRICGVGQVSLPAICANDMERRLRKPPYAGCINSFIKIPKPVKICVNQCPFNRDVESRLSQSTNRAAKTSRRFDFPGQIYGSTNVAALAQGSGVPTCGRFDDFEKTLDVESRLNLSDKQSVLKNSVYSAPLW